LTTATFRFYEELNDFLAPDRRRRDFQLACAQDATVKHAIESAGVPHTEVELILVDGRSVDFAYRMRDGDRVSVYPMFEAFDVEPLLRVRPAPLREPRFIADAQLGGLARRLRMLGFDTLYDNHAADRDIRDTAAAEHRTILSRDRQLLICRDVTHGCYVHALKPAEQLREVVDRLQLARAAKPFTRCLCCNVVLEPVAKADVLDRLPPAVASGQSSFKRCPACERVYWPGDHFRRMSESLSEVLAG
jgi:uncharacterized protein with PIN domain